MSVKIGLVSCGNWGKLILRDLLQLGCQVTVVGRSEKSRTNAQALSCENIVDSIANLKDVQGIIISSIIGMHFRDINECYKYHAGVPIFCEKPITNSVQDISNLIQNQKSPTFSMDKWRYHEGIKKLKEIIHSGNYGKLKGMICRREMPRNNHLDTDTVWVRMPHDLAIVLELLGYIPEVISALSIFKDQRIDMIHAVFGKDPWIEIKNSNRALKKTSSVELIFENATAILEDGFSNHINIYEWDITNQIVNLVPEKISFENKMPLYTELENFIEYLKNPKIPVVSSLDDSFKIISAIEAAALLGKRNN